MVIFYTCDGHRNCTPPIISIELTYYVTFNYSREAPSLEKRFNFVRFRHPHNDSSEDVTTCICLRLLTGNNLLLYFHTFAI